MSFIKSIVTGLLIFLPIISTAQSQNRQELRWARKAFRQCNNKDKFQHYSGDIQKPDSNIYQFGLQTLTVLHAGKELDYLLSAGIIYPEIIIGYVPKKIKTQEEINALSESERLLYNFKRADSLTISDLVLLKPLSHNLHKKRFKLYYIRHGMANLQICFLELTNEQATHKMSLDEFIRHSKVSCFVRGSILI